jgi:hypothetical protein
MFNTLIVNHATSSVPSTLRLGPSRDVAWSDQRVLNEVYYVGRSGVANVFLMGL